MIDLHVWHYMFKCLPLQRWNNISDPQKKDGRGVLDNKIAIEAQISIRLDRKKQTVWTKKIIGSVCFRISFFIVH